MPARRSRFAARLVGVLLAVLGVVLGALCIGLALSSSALPGDHGLPAREDPGARSYTVPSRAVLTLTIPRIGMRHAPVLEGPFALESGVEHLSDTSMPWSDTSERNVYLAGHRLGWPGTRSRLIFYRLDELAEGDEVLLRGRGETYRYRVSESFVVGPNARWVTGRVRGHDMLTLQTCTLPDLERRLIVRAERT